MLCRVTPHGGTEREHLESVERQTGKRPASLDGPDLPADATHVWLWFLDLSSTRGSNGFGPNPLAWTEIAAWASLTGIIVRPAEIEALLILDHAWLADYAKRVPKKSGG